MVCFLDPERQARADAAWDERPDASLDIMGNDQRCRSCGAPSGKKCMKADSSYRDYPHQSRIGDAQRFQNFNGGKTIGTNDEPR